MASTKKILRNGTIEWHNEAGRLHREDGPAIEYANGTKEWWVNGQRHRVNGPAIERADGAKFWYLNGKRHRVDGPACEWADGYKEWWLNSIYLSEQEHAWRVRHRYFDKIDGMPEKLKMEYLLVFG